MSADNWAVCPRCLNGARETLARETAAVADAYGKVSVEEFDERRARLEPVHEDDYCTFREDYEFYGAEEGEVSASYSGHCAVCNLGLDFKESRRFYEAGA